jgi:putative resolvase
VKAKEVLKILRITRPTLTKYVKEGVIEVETLVNGRYNYIDKSVYQFLNKEMKRKTVVYARVSTQKQKKDLENQVQTLINYANNNGCKVDEIYKDIKSGMHFERKGFQELLNSVMNNEIEKVFITYKDRFARLSFDLMEKLFKNFGTEIVVINRIENNEDDICEELFEVFGKELKKCYKE